MFCPYCRQEFGEQKDYVKNSNLPGASKRMVDSVLKLKCHNYQSGCPEVLSYSEMIEHEMKCSTCETCKQVYAESTGDDLFEMPDELPPPRRTSSIIAELMAHAGQPLLNVH
jgi:hypothetical protein